MIDTLDTLLRGNIHKDMIDLGFVPDDIMAMRDVVDAMMPQYIAGLVEETKGLLAAAQNHAQYGLTADYRVLWNRAIPKYQQRLQDLAALSRRYP